MSLLERRSLLTELRTAPEPQAVKNLPRIKLVSSLIYSTELCDYVFHNAAYIKNNLFPTDLGAPSETKATI